MQVVHVQPTSCTGSPKKVGDPILYKYLAFWSILAISSLGKIIGKCRERRLEREISQNKAIFGGLSFPTRRDLDPFG